MRVKAPRAKVLLHVALLLAPGCSSCGKKAGTEATPGAPAPGAEFTGTQVIGPHVTPAIPYAAPEDSGITDAVILDARRGIVATPEELEASRRSAAEQAAGAYGASGASGVSGPSGRR